jgi:ferric-dicitrate binding protein FerR (iron transport regulator)
MHELEQKDTIDLIAGYLTGQLSDEQLDVLNAWIKADKRNKQYFDDMRELWLAAPAAFPGKPFNKDAAYQLFLLRTRKKVPAKPAKERQPAYIWMFRVAAAVIVGFMLGAFYVFQTAATADVSSQAASQVDVIVPYGSRNHLILADGTKVWLNSGSRLRYTTGFGQSSREVYLEGEGYFDVARDTARVFIVKTDKLDVKALGTSFNVKAYPGEENIETVLVEGKVRIGNVELAPKEKAIYSRKNSQLTIEKKASENVRQSDKPLPKNAPVAKIVETPIDPAIYVSWKDDLWRIESESLGSLAVKLERRYNVQIRFADRNTQMLGINAVIKDESLEQVLRFLQLSVPIDFKIDGKHVVLKEDRYLKERYKGYYKQK